MAIAKIKKINNIAGDEALSKIKSLPTETYKIEENKELFSGMVTSLTDELQPASLTQIFSYLNFSSNCHYEAKKELKPQQKLSDFFKVQINLEYNFLIREFEKHITDNRVPELNLPNFYDTINLELSKETTFNSVDFFEQDLLKKYPTDLTIQNKDSYTKIFYNSNLDESLAQTVSATKFSEYLKKYNAFKEQFPYYTEIFIDNSEIPKPTISIPNRNDRGGNFSLKTFNDIFEKYSLHEDAFSYFDKNKSSIKLNQAEQKDSEVTEEIIDINLTDLITFFNNIIVINPSIISEINAISSLYQITYSKIVSNTACYSEVVGYKIYKYDTEGNLPLQEFYIPNSREKTTEFIDTQIKYGKKYRYKVSLLTIVIGTDYKYINNSQDKKTINFELQPKIFLVEIDSMSYQNFLLDSPPIEPEVDIIPFVGIQNKIKFNLNTAVGRKLEEPITFTDQEKENVRKLKDSQDRIDNLIKFESEEPSDFFEIYRLEKEPKTFNDFIGSKKIVAENNESSAGSYVDALVPNKKFYYTFRSVDYHGNVSNPSVVYVVEIINDNGTIFPLITTLEIKPDPLKMESKKFRRFLSISPNLSNTLISLEKNNNFEGLTSKESILKDAKIGLNQQGVWDKKFKIRINSISSGRKIDINVTFKIDKKSQ
jgi:hypothetical protein